MKYFGQFWQKSTGYVKGSVPPVFRKDAVEPIPACGDRGIVRLSGRQAGAWVGTLKEECRRRGFIGFSIVSGESLLTAKEIRKYEEVLP